MLLRRRREILHFEITESIKTGRILFIMVPSVSLPVGISHFRANLNSHEANADAAAPQAWFNPRPDEVWRVTRPDEGVAQRAPPPYLQK